VLVADDTRDGARTHLPIGPDEGCVQRRALLSALGAVSLPTVAGCLEQSPSRSDSQTSAQQSDIEVYPAGAGPESIDFSVVGADEATLLSLSHDGWESYAFRYDEPADRPRVEGEYYVDTTTGEIVSALSDDARDYRDGEEYASIRPAGPLSDQERERLEDDPKYVYDADTDAYYRYDPQYGEVAPTNVGRHPTILESYEWTATGEATHHGVAVVTYELASEESRDSNAPAASAGSLSLGADDGIVYAFDLTLDVADGARYTYSVEPAAFPARGWVETAKRVAGSDSESTETY
jgi:hypothetical protein